MKKLLTLSMLFNLGLLGWMVAGRKNVSDPVLSGAMAVRPAVNGVAALPPQPVPQAETAPFRWSQLRAADYHVYVKNLRGIGCPEPTVRAIVTADVHAAFRSYSQSLIKKLSDLAGGSESNQLAAGNTGAVLRAELQALPDAEAAKVADFLGLKPVSVQADTVAAAAASGKRVKSQPDKPVSMPYALQNIDTAPLNLTEDQKQAINDLRQVFMDQIGGTNQNPDDPEYLARWRKAQPLADNMLRHELGNDIFIKYTLLLDDQNSQ